MTVLAAASSWFAHAHSARQRTRRAAQVAVLVCSVFTGACIDLAEPSIPNLSGPAVVSLTMRRIKDGPVDVSGTLTPGRDSAGVPRKPISAFIAAGAALPLTAPNAQGTFVLSQQVPADADFVGPYEVQPPLMTNAPPLPVFRWYGIRRLDRDTVHADSSGDVTLHVRSDFGIAVTPATRSQQWFLELRGDAGGIRVNGDGMPPDTLRIPSQFIPRSPSGTVIATLIYFQSATAVSPGSTYIASITLDTRVEWTIRL